MGLKSIPSVVQLPGGVVLKGLAFKVIERNSNGSPKVFELLPAGVNGDPASDDSYVLWAHEEGIRRPDPKHAKVGSKA